MERRLDNIAPVARVAGIYLLTEHTPKQNGFILKNCPVKGLCGRFQEFIDWRDSQSCWYFSTQLCELLPSNLLSGHLSPTPPPSCVNYLVYTYTVCKGRGVWGHRRGGGLRQINTYRKVHKVLYRTIFYMPTFCFGDNIVMVISP